MESQFENIDLENVKSTFQSNIIQMFAVTKFALPHMKRGASIINSTSITAYKGSPALSSYNSRLCIHPPIERWAALQSTTRPPKEPSLRSPARSRCTSFQKAFV
jgi:NAD(P)-dependent dehydrogenase (short-subunit alcohol dehydrogenase family)